MKNKTSITYLTRLCVCALLAVVCFNSCNESSKVSEIDKANFTIDSLKKVANDLKQHNISLTDKNKELTEKINSISLFESGYIDKLTRKIEKMERNEISGSDAYTSSLIKEDWVINERLKNTKKGIKRYFDVMRDVENCNVSKTQDTQDYVITFSNSKNQTCEIWLHGEKVNSILSYDDDMFERNNR